jgi:WD40 repeat protein
MNELSGINNGWIALGSPHFRGSPLNHAISVSDKQPGVWVAGSDGWVRIFDPADGRVLGAFETQLDAIRGMRLSHDEETLVVASRRQLGIYDVQHFNQPILLTTLDLPVSCLTSIPNSYDFLLGTHDQERSLLRLCIDSGKATVQDFSSLVQRKITSVTVNPSGTIALASSEDGFLFSVLVTSGLSLDSVSLEDAKHRITAVCCNKDGTLVFAGNERGSVFSLSLAADGTLRKVSGTSTNQNRLVTCLVATPHSDRVIVADQSGCMLSMTSDLDGERSETHFGNAINAMETHLGNTVFVASSTPMIRKISLYGEVETFDTSGNVSSVRNDLYFEYDSGTKIVSLGIADAVVWKDSKQLASVRFTPEKAVAYSTIIGRSSILLAYESGRAEIIDLVSGESRDFPVLLPENCRGLSVSRRAGRLSCLAANGVVSLHDSSSGETIDSWNVLPLQPSSIKLTSNGKFVVMGSWGKAMHCLDVSTGSWETVDLEETISNQCAASCDGRVIVGATQFGAAYFARREDADWSVSKLPIKLVTCVLMSDCGRYVFFGQRQGTVGVYDSTEREARTFPVCTSPIRTIAYDPAESLLAAGTARGMVYYNQVALS